MAMRLAVTVGDPAGIGPEVVLKALARTDRPGAEMIVYGPASVLRERAARFGLRPLESLGARICLLGYGPSRETLKRMSAPSHEHFLFSAQFAPSVKAFADKPYLIERVRLSDLYARIVRKVFERRHSVLRRKFGKLRVDYGWTRGRVAEEPARPSATAFRMGHPRTV